MRRTVKDQAALDKALADGVHEIVIDSPAGVWLTLTSSDSSSVEARGSSRVVAWGSSSVEAWDSSRVVAWGSSRVVAWGSSSVEARDSSRVVAWGSSSVEARDSSSVEARDSSRVVAWGSSRVVAWGSSSVEAWDSSSVEARDSSSVEARDSSSVEAGKYVAVHLHSQRVSLSGGVVIDMTRVDPTTLDDWLDLTGVRVADGHVTLYKAADADLMAGRRYRITSYKVGSEVVCPDWRDDSECGGGLHVSPTPSQAAQYADDNPRFLECRVAVEDIRCIDTSKVKCKRLTVVREVDRWGDPLGGVS